jgi:hypothetical protein
MMKRASLGWLVLVLSMLLVGGVQAQDETALEYVSQDGSLRIQYAPYWAVEEDDAGWIDMTGEANNPLLDGIQLTIWTPIYLENIELLDAATDSAEELAEDFITFFETLDLGDPEPYEAALFPLEGIRADFSQSWLNERNLTDGYVVVLAIDDRYVIVIALSSGINDVGLDAQVELLAATFETGDFEPTSPATGSNEEVAAFMEGLVDDDWVPRGGDLLLYEEVLQSGSEGLNTLFDDMPYTGTDFVFSAVISFRPFEGVDLYCGVLSRVEPSRSGRDEPGLFIGWDADSRVVAYATDNPPPDGDLLLRERTSVDIFTPHTLLALYVDGELTLVVDGEVEVERETLDVPRIRADETFFGLNMNPSCVMTEFWVWGWE